MVHEMKTSKEKVRQIISERCMTSYMNNTKWETLFANLKEYTSRIDVKCILFDKRNGWTSEYLVPAPKYFEPLPMGPIAFSEIEWLLIDPKNYESTVKYLEECGVPFSIEDGLVKIWGYSESAVKFV